jgi:uroporphyrin-III C-methyltransferase/precorrin-2 dehydrogenase/sirohydrochlorin ferrochelatase
VRHPGRVTYPLHLDLAGRRVLVVGGGQVAARRTRALVQARAAVEVVSPATTEGFPSVPVQRREFVAGDVDGAWLVLACTGAVDDDVAAACEQRQVWCVRADDAAQSPAWVPAVARVDDVVVSVTAGRDPRRAVALRDALALSVETGELPLRRARPGAGSVAVIDAGPGDPGLLTVRGRRLLAGADVVVRDRLAPDVGVPAGVEVVEVGSGRDMAALLIEHAGAGKRVVRLKGGDGLVVGGGIEELAACVQAGVPVEVVPGVPAAFAAVAYAGIPVATRGVTQSVAVVSAHLPPGSPGSTVDWDALARVGGTLVLLMAVDRLPGACAALIAGGRSPETPLAVVQDATLPRRSTVVTTLAKAAVDCAGVRAPAVVVVGEVVASRIAL